MAESREREAEKGEKKGEGRRLLMFLVEEVERLAWGPGWGLGLAGAVPTVRVVARYFSAT